MIQTTDLLKVPLTRSYTELKLQKEENFLFLDLVNSRKKSLSGVRQFIWKKHFKLILTQ